MFPGITEDLEWLEEFPEILEDPEWSEKFRGSSKSRT
jgi:hypothetical protein